MVQVAVQLDEGFDPRSRTGSDVAQLALKLFDVGFDPRSRTGSNSRRNAGAWLGHVSIHAPARGATYPGKPSSPASWFRSTLPHGEQLA